MQRALTSAVLVVLLVATAGAFAITERLKLEKSAVFGTLISRRISPVCRCPTASARIRFKLRHADVLTLRIVNASRSPVDTIVAGRRVSGGVRVFDWNGRTGTGQRAPDGTYYVELHLAKQHRTFLLPNQLVVDTIPPEVVSATAERNMFSPDGDHQVDAVAVRFRLSEPAFVEAYVLGRRIVLGRFHRPVGAFTWAGTARGGSRLPPSTYVLSLGAVDLAGNRTPMTTRAHVRVTLRYIALANHRVSGVRTHSVLEIGVSTDAKRYRWRLGSKHGFAHGPVLRVRVPALPGHYRLVVTEHGHSDHAVVIVR